MRGFARLRELNWVALGAEVVLIFVGITLALWFENANEDRRQWVRETGMLGEVADALDADIYDISANLREEQLKVAGLDLVRNDNLRLAIVNYYERRVQIVREWGRWVANPAWQEQMVPQMLRRFRFAQRKVPAPPIDYAALLDDTEYQNVLRHTAFALGLKDVFYGRLLDVARSLSEQIRAELEQRV